MNPRIRPQRALSLAAVALALLAPSGRSAKQAVAPFEEATVFFELNDTDGDLGIHGLVDGDAWRRLQILDAERRRLLDVSARSQLRRHGLTEIFFESDEPPFDELSPAEFFARFPAGEYEIEGVTVEGERLASEVEVSHVMPAPADEIELSGQPAAENCDADPLPLVSAPVVIDWAPVTASHPTIGEPGPIAVDHYQLVVEREEPQLLVFSVDLPAGVTEFELPEDFTDLGDEFKFEILVRATNGNQTAVESCFEVE
jgi:hypothetical protein